MEQTGKQNSFRLRRDPLRVFKESKTPAGLYARKKWLGESGSSKWQNHFDQTVRFLLGGQSEDGSWGGSALETIHRLFDLHLTVRDRTEEIDRALGWLLRRTLRENLSRMNDKPLSSRTLRALPFTEGSPRIFYLCAALFLATVFQHESGDEAFKGYRLLHRWVDEHSTGEADSADQSNALRALIVHPDYAENRETVTLIEHLARIQEPSGRWPAPVPFFQTINALGHSRLPLAHRQWMKTLDVLFETQNDDGSWGRQDAEWNTFLVVHALKNKGCL